LLFNQNEQSGFCGYVLGNFLASFAGSLTDSFVGSFMAGFVGRVVGEFVSSFSGNFVGSFTGSSPLVSTGCFMGSSVGKIADDFGGEFQRPLCCQCKYRSRPKIGSYFARISSLVSPLLMQICSHIKQSLSTRLSPKKNGMKIEN